MSQPLDDLATLRSPDDLFRRRLLTVYSFAFIAQFFGAMIQRMTSDTIYEATPIGAIMVCSACLAGALSAYCRWHMRTVGRAMMLMGGASIVLILIFQGGLTSYNAGTLFILPAVCALILGSRDTAFFAVFVIGSLIGLRYFDNQLPAFNLPPDDVLGATFRSLLIVSVMIIVSLVFLVRETESTDARLRALLEHHKFAATHDALTGLSNRTAMNTFMAELDKSQDPHDFYLIDLDGFKPMNDTFGHATGDDVLVQISERLVAASPPHAIVARLGGDEFFVAVPLNPSAETNDIALGARLTKALTISKTAADLSKTVTASVGSARFPDDDATTSDALSKADQALYAAKAAGKGIHIAYRQMDLYHSRTA